MTDDTDDDLFKREGQPKKPFEHYCHCGKWGAFGHGVNLRKDQIGEWFCFEHRPNQGDRK